MVRIQSVDNGEMKKYDDNMTVSILTDRQRHLSYLCIMKDGEVNQFEYDFQIVL